MTASTNNIIFDTVKRGEKVSNVIDRWVIDFRENRVAALAEIVNFTLMASGVEKCCLPKDLDLEALDADDLNDILADVVSELVGADKSRLYPLYVNPKQQGKTSSGSGNGFRSKYIDFWEKFADHLRSAGDEDLEGLEGLRCLHTVLDQLIALSRTSVVNVRDAVTEAVLSCSLRLQYGGVELRTRVETVQRQLNAELKKLKDQSDKAKSSPRYQAIEKQKKRSNDMLKLMEEILSEIFTSTFVYRFKDVHEGVRALCVRRLCQHMCADPKEMIKDDNLKYIGWSCSDHSASVRLEAVKSVGTLIKIDTKNRNQSMKLFVERFNNRFIEIAGGDVDESISYSMIGILRTLCQQGELDRLSEKQLDQIDEIVFDGQVKENVRAEALGFFMDHTQGFDDEAEDDDTDHEVQATSQDSSKKAKISKKNKSDEESALRRQRNIALQLETLTEFAEHQLRSPGQIVLTDLLASAVLQSSKKGLLLEWSTMSAMLLREGESLVSAPLRPEQTHILLRLWAYSASRLRQWYVETFQGVNISGEKATNKGNQRTRSADDVSRLSSWEALSTVLKNSGAKLLTQFRDSSPELSLVIDLLRCYDVNASFSGDKTFKSFKAVLKTTTDLFESLPDRDILIKLAELFSSWYALDGTASSSTSITIKSLLQSLWQSITGNYEVLQNIATGTSSSSKGSKRKSSSRGNSQEDGRDTAYNLNVSLFKYSALWKMMNCRQLVDLKEEEIFTILKDICAQTISIAESQSNALLKNNTFEGDLAATCTSSVAVMHTILLWLTRSLYLVGVKVRQETASGVSPTEDAVTAMTEQVVHLRDSLLETLCAWMTTDIDQELGTRFNQFHRVLQRTAFRLVGDIRMLFQARAATCKIVEGVAYIPAQDVLGALRKVFELEGQRLRSNIREIEEVDEEEANRLATVLVHSLLNPLSYSLYFDIENLNRRQAAAVLCYSLEPQKVISDNVKATMKSLKDRDAVKYLEVQMVALKSVFHEHVVTHIRRKTQAESGDAEDSGFDFDECERQVEAGLDNVIALARKFAGSFGIGRVKDPTLLEALLRFFELAIDLTFSEEENIGFVSAMEPYIRLIQSDKCSLIKNYLETKISSKTDIAHQLASNQRAGLPLDMRSLLSFRDKISGSVGSNKRTRCGKVTDEEEEEVDDDIHAGAVQSKVVSVDASSSRRGPSWGPSATHTSFRLGGASQIASQSSVGVRYPMSKPAMTQSKSQLSQPTRSKVVEDFIDDDGMDNDAGDHDDDDDDESENDSEAPKLGTGTRLNYSMSPIAHRDSRQTTHRPSMLSSINDSAFSHPAMGLMLDDLADDSAFQSLGYRREGEPGGPRGGSGEGVRGDDKEDKDDNVDDDEDEEDEFAQLSKISKRKYAL